jgi:lysophospholipase L1-like esterase
MVRFILSLAALVTAASAAAQPAPPVGMVSDPCEGLAVAVPDAVKAHFRTIAVLPEGSALPTPPSELAAFRQANSEARKSDWADLCRYRADNERLRAGPASERRVVFIGDSITELWGLDDSGLFSGGIVNRGISGQTSPQILLRFEADVVALQPTIVHILAGTNDIAGNTGPTSADQYKNNIKAMVTLAKANGIRVILGSLPPAGHFAWKPDLKPAAQIVALNSWLQSYAKAEKLEFIDYYAALVTGDGAMNPDLSFDGVHPNHQGYRVMTRVVRSSVSDR